MSRMTAAEAQTFSGYSGSNAEVLVATAEIKGCQCKPYVNWFTYRRWFAQGYQVQKGEKGIKLTSWIPITKKDEEGNEISAGRRPKGYTVFCQCQVKEINNV